MADYSPPGQIDGLGGKVLQHKGNTPAAIFELHVHPHDVQPIWEVCFVLRVGRLHHDIQSIPHHHCPLSVTMSDDGLEPWYCTFVRQQDFLVKI